jgi:hypothetical protein
MELEWQGGEVGRLVEDSGLSVATLGSPFPSLASVSHREARSSLPKYTKFKEDKRQQNLPGFLCVIIYSNRFHIIYSMHFSSLF